MKKLLKLAGAQQLNRIEQKSVNGGGSCKTLEQCEDSCPGPGICLCIVGTSCWVCKANRA